MNKQKMMIWGREFDLEVVFDCYAGEDILPTQTESLAEFIKNSGLINQAKSEVEKYCIERDADIIGSNHIDNIFRYVIPKSIFIQHTKDMRRVVGLMCTYKFDKEHGLAVIFENERFKSVSSQDAIL